MQADLAQEAINSALSGKWEKAIEINKKILDHESENTDAMNRLARAYAELGEIKKAKLYAEKVIKIDPFNMIASRSLEKWKSLKKGETYKSAPANAQLFLEEPGKTKIVSLRNLGDANLLAKLDAGDEVNLNNHGHRTCITTVDGKYIGRLPDDLSSRLRKLILLGNKYRVFIKSSVNKEVKIFIREINRTEKLKDTPSFSPEMIDYVSFTSPELVHNKDEIAQQINTEEEE